MVLLGRLLKYNVSLNILKCLNDVPTCHITSTLFGNRMLNSEWKFISLLHHPPLLPSPFPKFLEKEILFLFITWYYNKCNLNFSFLMVLFWKFRDISAHDLLKPTYHLRECACAYRAVLCRFINLFLRSFVFF